MVAVWTCIFWTGLWKWSVSGSARWGVFARIHWLRGVRRTPSNLLTWGQCPRGCIVGTPRLRLFKSTQILTSPHFLGTGTILAHQSVGSVTFSIMPLASIHSSSRLHGSIDGIAISLSVAAQYGVWPSFRLILTSSVLMCIFLLGAGHSRLSIRCTNPICSETLRPSRHGDSGITATQNLYTVSLRCT